MNRKVIIFTAISISILLFGIFMSVFGLVKLSTVVVEKDFHSKTMNEQQEVYVYLPAGYDLKFLKRYPVLYMLDGEIFFHEQSGRSKGKWSMKMTLDRLIKEGKINKMIVVGISSNENRIDKFTPSENTTVGAGGELDDYSQFIIEELKPFIDTKYRTLKEKEHTSIGGSSLGGLAALHIFFNHTETFSKIGALSPAIWWNDYEILHSDSISSALINEKNDLGLFRSWMDAGVIHNDDLLENIGGSQEFFQQLKQFKDILVAQGISEESIQVELHNPEKNRKKEEDIDTRLEKMLMFLFFDM